MSISGISATVQPQPSVKPQATASAAPSQEATAPQNPLLSHHRKHLHNGVGASASAAPAVASSSKPGLGGNVNISA